ncbi:MFS transporter [Saccharopolyspora cebuensis]|uniref:MFS transporter n=1 Tax=Saccharopolyspora cebuensis TaxID=418759 RepID=A0ABV4CFP1_9PSEU
MSETPTSSPLGSDADGEALRPDRSRAHHAATVALLVLLVEITGLTYTMVTPALPLIAATFRTPHVAWTITAVTLVGAVAFALCGKLGDLFGKKKVALVCAGVFAAGSVVSALADSFAVLIAGRALQGVGPAVLTLTYGLVRDVLPRSLIPIALGFLGTGMGASAIFGPVLSGVLVEGFGFRGIFWFQVLYVVVIGALVLLLVPESSLRSRAHLDWVGALLLGAGTLALLAALSGAEAAGWSSPGVLGGIALGVALLATWFRHERRTAEPLVDFALLRQRRVALTLVASFWVQFTLVSASMLVPLLVMTPAGTGYGFSASPLEVAVFMAASGVAGMIAGPISGAVARRRGPRLTLVVGGASLATGSAVLAVLPGAELSALPGAELWVLVGHFIIGIGIGTCTASLPNLITVSVPAGAQGISGGMLNLLGSLGSSLGSQLAVVLLLVPAATYAGDRVVYGQSGFVLAFAACAGAGALALVSAIAMGPVGPRR